MTTILLATFVFGLCLAGIALRVILKKDTQIRGTCASNNPLLKNDDGTCKTCGQEVPEVCDKEEK